MDSREANRDFLPIRILVGGILNDWFGNEPQAPSRAHVPFDLGGNDGGCPNEDLAWWVMPDGEHLLLAGHANVATGKPEQPNPNDFALARPDHGLDIAVLVTPKPGAYGTPSPTTTHEVLHSDHAGLVVLPDTGYILDRIEKGRATATAAWTARCS